MSVDGGDGENAKADDEVGKNVKQAKQFELWQEN
jgi:hypothetical protein